MSLYSHRRGSPSNEPLHPVLEAGAREEKDGKSIDLPHHRYLDPPTSGQSPQGTAIPHFSSCESATAIDEGEKSSTTGQGETSGAITPPKMAMPVPSPMPGVQSAKRSPSTPPPRTSLSPESSGMPPPRTTLMLPDDMALASPAGGTDSSRRRADVLEPGVEDGADDCPTPNPGSLRKGGRAPTGGDGRSVSERRTASSPRLSRSRRGSEGFHPGKGVSRRPRRTPRVLTTSSDFANTIRRVCKVCANQMASVRWGGLVSRHSASPPRTLRGSWV